MHRRGVTKEVHVENIEKTTEEPVELTIEELEMEWWQPLSCGCDPSSED